MPHGNLLVMFNWKPGSKGMRFAGDEVRYYSDAGDECFTPTSYLKGRAENEKST